MGRIRKRRSIDLGTDEITSKQQKLWLLRCITKLNGKNKFIEKDRFADDTIARAVGLEDWIDVDKSVFCRKTMIKEMEAMLVKMESKDIPPSEDVRVLEKNIARLSTLTPMTKVDQLVLSFLAQLHTSDILEECFHYLNLNTLNQVIRSLAVILNVPKSVLSLSLSSKGKLIRCGLLSYYRHGHSLRGKFDFISDKFMDSLHEPNVDLDVLLAELFSLSVPPTLKINDYGHLVSQIQLVEDYLAKAKSSSGINVLIYGPPGTGKTELVRLIAKRLNKTLYLVADIDAEGDVVAAGRRLQSYRSCQSFLNANDSLVLFDEVEDIFNDGGFFSPSTASKHKSWMNQALETNPVPTFWLSNSTWGIDAAYVRRFDIVFEATVPPKRQRKLICKQVFGNRLSDELADVIADNDNVTPAIVQRVAKVARTINGKTRLNEVDIRLMVDNILINQGHKPLKKQTSISTRFNPEYTPCNANWPSIVEGLANTGEGRLCLYGPPGTGKTAASQYLAEQLDKPLHSHKVSDLMSKWVGGTEEQIAKAFESAQADDAVLLLDEVDSFLRDRASMSHSWEITMVNEMLTQMEQYSGIFIASTNLVDSLDKAALRRFDIKIQFHYLSLPQRIGLFSHYCQQFEVCHASSHDAKLAQLQTLTPGDFAAIARRHRFSPVTSADELFECLIQECKLKPSSSSAIGFVH